MAVRPGFFDIYLLGRKKDGTRDDLGRGSVQPCEAVVSHGFFIAGA